MDCLKTNYRSDKIFPKVSELFGSGVSTELNNLWITYTDGSAIQDIHYLPFGEEQIDQRLTSFNSRYTFSAKEKDIETNYSYFGARYYTSDLSIWLSVDPMSDKYPNMSPYVYCANNPVILIDPNGEEVEADESSQSNIKNTLTKREARFVRFDENGQLDKKRLNKSKSTSENMTALKTLSNSETIYSFQVGEAGHNGEKFFDKDASGNYSRGVTEFPGAENNPTPDNKVHIVVGSVLSEQQQAMTTAHEAYGHALFYEFKQQGQNVEPNHTYKSEGFGEWDEKLQMKAFVSVKVPTNTQLEKQITTVVNQAKTNYENRKK